MPVIMMIDDVENENDWHRQARGRREPVYLLLHQQGGQSQSLGNRHHTITFITFSGNTGISIIVMLYLY